MAQFSIFEWDEAKALRNQRKHGVYFPVAAKAFEDPAAIRIDATKPTDGNNDPKRSVWSVTA